MEALCSTDLCLQYLSDFQKRLDAVQTCSQQNINSVNTINAAPDVNNISWTSFKLEWLFEKVEEADPRYLDLHLLRLYIISKLFKLSNPMYKIDGESRTQIEQFVKQITETKLSTIVSWLSAGDELVGYATMNTLLDICLTPAASHVTAKLYLDLVRHATFADTTTRHAVQTHVLALCIKLVKLALKAIKAETDDGEINKHNVHYVEAMKLVYLFGNSSEVRVELLKHNTEECVRANIELYILLLKLVSYLSEEHLSAQHVTSFKANIVRDCVFVLGTKVTAEYSSVTAKKYLRLCALLTSVLSVTDLDQLLSALHVLSASIFTTLPGDSETSIFGQEIVLATRRLFILLVLDITKNLLSSLTSIEHVTLLSKIGSTAVSLLQKFTPKELTAAFFELFQEQDDDLMTGLWHWLSVYSQWNLTTTYNIVSAHLPRELVEAIGRLTATFNPHAMFHEFLTVVDFDHNVLLDFLVSNETDFLLYLLQYLKYTTTDWKGFTTIMAQFDSNEAEQYLAEAKNSDMSEESQRELEEMLLSMSKLKINRTANTNASVESDEVKRVINVLHKLGAAINRLVAKDLFPYNIAPLLKWIAATDQLRALK